MLKHLLRKQLLGEIPMKKINKEVFLNKAIEISSDKGGVGKSTMSINLFEAIRRSTDLETGLFVDTDPQKTSTDVYDVRTSLGDDYKTPEYLSRDTAIHSHIKNVIHRHSYVLFDTQGADSRASREIMKFADVLIVPVNPSGFVVKKLTKMLKNIAEAKISNENLQVFIVFNMVDKRNKKQLRKYKADVQEILNNLLGLYGFTSDEAKIHICESFISYKQSLYNEMETGRNIFEIAEGVNSDPLTEYEALLEEIADKMNNNIQEVAA
ncbi:hypothetical protein IPC755_28735 [Pseudomonas aeruginosa]|jgi:chromosome partitioning protein|nr:hypothetical protein IPC755_28735 [Pseudomonas aeruginosa]